MKQTLKRTLSVATSGLLLLGCQYVSGLNELEVVEETSDERDTDDSTSGVTSTNDDSTSSSGECTIPSGLSCAPSNNCGCEPGEVCGLIANDDDLTVGCQAPGEAKQGDPCQLGDCGSGLLCIHGTCEATCRFTSDCEADEATCTLVKRPNGESLSGVRYCYGACDLVSPSDPDSGFRPCDAAQSCVLTPSGSTCVNVVGDGEQGDDCKNESDCAAGFTCLEGECKQWCSETSPSCPVGYFCEAASNSGAFPAGFGVCGGGCPATIPEGDECLTIPNCGCGPTQTCRAMESGNRACSPTGPVGTQAACSNSADCASELACIGGLCRPYCDPEQATCEADGQCIQVYYGDAVLEGVGACLGTCDPVDPNNDDRPYTPCGEGAECEVGYDGLEYVTSYCKAANTKDVGQTGPCADDYSCAESSTCIVDRCYPLCRESDDCAGVTEFPLCFNDNLGYFGAQDDPIGVCCSPTPVDGSTCSAFTVECGCEPGFTCRSAIDDDGYYFYDGHTVCSPVGEIEKQARCASDSDCIEGTSCIGFPVSLCRPHCSDSCEAGQGACAEVTLDEYVLPFARVCLGHCDPVNPSRSDEEVTPCGEGGHCAAGWQGETDPVSRASFCIGESLTPVGVGGTCEFDDDCTGGLACDLRSCPPTDDSCKGVCVEYCYTTADCLPGTVCNLDVGRVIVQNTPVGYCELPVIGPDPVP